MDSMMKDLDAAAAKAVDELDRELLRPRQLKGFKCCIDCASQKAPSHQETQECYQKCTADAERATAVVSNEMAALMKTFDGCVSQCQQEAYDGLRSEGPRPAQASIDKAQDVFNGCAGTCIQKSLAKLTTLRQRVVTQL